MKKVLLASASLVLLKRNTTLLMERGFELFTTTCGAEALTLNAHYCFDLILADLKLEDMSGCTLCSLLREEDCRDIPVILICHNIPGSIERVEQSGATAMLLKPIDPSNLLGTIGSFIGLQLGRSKRVELKVSLLGKLEEMEFSGISHDISNSGILLETDAQLFIGSRFNCQFTLPGSVLIETTGKVIRGKIAAESSNLYGVKFVDPPPLYCRAINNYVASVANSAVYA